MRNITAVPNELEIFTIEKLKSTYKVNVNSKSEKLQTMEKTISKSTQNKMKNPKLEKATWLQLKLINDKVSSLTLPERVEKYCKTSNLAMEIAKEAQTIIDSNFNSDKIVMLESYFQQEQNIITSYTSDLSDEFSLSDNFAESRDNHLERLFEEFGYLCENAVISEHLDNFNFSAMNETEIDLDAFLSNFSDIDKDEIK